MKLFLLIIFIALASLGLQSCTGCKNTTKPTPDNPYGLPNATQTGANTMGCLINGKTVNLKSISTTTFPNATLFGDTLLWFAGNSVTRIFQLMPFQIKYPKQSIIYTINQADSSFYIKYDTDSTCLGISSNVTNSTATSGTVTLTKIDKSNHIVSGTFNCKIPISNCDTLNITDGRFDIKY